MIKILIPILAFLLFLSGCATYQPSRTAQVRQTEDQLIQQENQRRMNGRIEILEREIDRISLELDSLRQTLDARINGLERKSEQDKREMIAQITSRLEKLMTRTPTPSPTPSGGGTMQGYEHIVQQGDTLSTIAKAYNVTTKTLIEVNKLKNPDRLSVGQKLFIPE